MAAFEIVITFPSVHHAMRAEQALKAEGIEHNVIPVPRTLSSDCGVAVFLPKADPSNTVDLLRTTGIVIDACYHRHENSYERLNLDQ
jgi:hypothetical protein